jgi:hypothetical protein
MIEPAAASSYSTEPGIDPNRSLPVSSSRRCRRQARRRLREARRWKNLGIRPTKMRQVLPAAGVR